MYNNEQIGLAGEVAIADVFNVPIESLYRKRTTQSLIESITPIIPGIFTNENIPQPIAHIAERQNKVDFNLANGGTLSVKTNQKGLGKVAPQVVGQASSTTFFPFFASIIPATLVPSTHAAKTQLFKATVFSHIDKMLEIYWSNMFDCDYLIHIYNVLNRANQITNNPKYIVLSKRDSPVWDRQKITFTQNLESWNESNTVKYDGISIGEFQIHSNRDNFKFRFNLDGVTKLIDAGII